MEARRLWDPVPEFDSIFSVDNVLNDDIFNRHDKHQIERITQLMLEDALKHFAHKERLSIDMNYPRTEEHRPHHAELIKTLQKVLKIIRQSDFNQDWIELAMAIKRRLIEHVLNEDTLYNRLLEN